jgi:hypothetical protein
LTSAGDVVDVGSSTAGAEGEAGLATFTGTPAAATGADVCCRTALRCFQEDLAEDDVLAMVDDRQPWNVPGLWLTAAAAAPVEASSTEVAATTTYRRRMLNCRSCLRCRLLADTGRPSGRDLVLDAVGH